MPSRSIIRTGVGPHREPRNRFPAIAAAINLLAARAARVQSRRNLSRSLSPKLDHSHSITRFDRSRTGPKSGEREPIGARIIEAPADVGRFVNRDARVRFAAYVPPGSVAAGRVLAAKPEIACRLPRRE